MGSLPNLHVVGCSPWLPALHTYLPEQMSPTNNKNAAAIKRCPTYHRRQASYEASYKHRVATPVCDDYFQISRQYSGQRRDSPNSSAGASSVRRLIAVVRATPSRLGPIYSRRVILRNVAALCLGHGIISAALLPLLALQASISSWQHFSNQYPTTIASDWLFQAFLLSAFTTFLSPVVIAFFGIKWTLVIGYSYISLFFLAHLFPKPLPLYFAYLFLGVFLGPLVCARLARLVSLTQKLGFMPDDNQQVLMMTLNRSLQGSQNIGMVLGNLITWLFIYNLPPTEENEENLNLMFEESDDDPVCGSAACQKWTDLVVFGNETVLTDSNFLPCRTATFLAGVYVGCGVASVAFTSTLTNRINKPLEIAKTQFLKPLSIIWAEPNLQLFAPLAVFLGLQQGFMYGTFGKWYVACSMGLTDISLVFLSMAFLQSVAAFTLSLLLQHVSRLLVAVTGFVFHICLIFVLLLWKPAGDDSALLHVISSAWGVCHAIWETLHFCVLINFHRESDWQGAVTISTILKFIGAALAFCIKDRLCVHVQLYILTAGLLLSFVPYVIVIRVDLLKK